MELVTWLPFLASASFGLAAPVLARRLPPALAAWLLSVGGLIAAAGTTAVLGFLAFTWVGQTPLVAEQGRWSISTLRHADPVPGVVELTALAGLTWIVARLVTSALRQCAAFIRAYRLAAALPPQGAELAVIDDPAVAAYAVPGRRGRVVASTGLLRTLDAPERRAVLLHERSHLRHRHHVHQIATRIAVAANPLLGRLPSALTLATERWADEDAAGIVHRDTVASAVAHAASNGRVSTLSPTIVLAVAAEHVAERIHALQAPPPGPSAWRIATLLFLVLVTSVGTAMAAHDTERLFELAKDAYLAAHR